MVRATVIALALCAVASSAQSQSWRKHEQRRPAAPAAPAISVDRRDKIITASGPFNDRPYWLALAECGGIYFKLNVLYTDAAVNARVVKPDPKANAEFSKKLATATKVATAYFDGAEHFLMTDRAIERADAVLTYDGQSRAAGQRFKTVEAGLVAAKPCPPLYQACRDAYPKQCARPLPAAN
jgi:hypothetical protein